jgi:hypothetical protein
MEMAFGNYQTPIKTGAFFLTEDDIFYSAGKHIVSYNLIRKKQTFYAKDKEDEEITAMTYYIGKKSVSKQIAVALKSNSKELPLVRVYFLNKKIAVDLSHNSLGTSKNIVGLTFICKGKYLVTLCELKHMDKYVVTTWHVSTETEVDVEQKIEINVNLESFQGNNQSKESLGLSA